MDEKLLKLISIFNQTFDDTILVAGGEEPLYLPKTKKLNHCQLIFRSHYFSSALHEISHWCIAGSERRKLVDFGYWYHPDGRTKEQQKKFEVVEIKPQALEWIFSDAFGHHFNFSYDNLDNGISSNPSFENAVKEQKEYYLNNGLPKRAQMLIDQWPMAN